MLLRTDDDHQRIDSPRPYTSVQSRSPCFLNTMVPLQRIGLCARVAPDAVLYGEVTIGANRSIGLGAMLTAESNSITIGSNCVIMNTTAVASEPQPCAHKDNVVVRAHVHLTGCEVEGHAFPATRAALFSAEPHHSICAMSEPKGRRGEYRDRSASSDAWQPQARSAPG
jgi:hypothetical protein